MLRHVLDAAAAEAEETVVTDIPGSESTSLAQESAGSRPGYGSTETNNQADNDDAESLDYDEEDSTSYTSEDLPDEERGPCMERCWMGVKECFATIADVDNLWDESEGHITRRNRLVVLLWFFLLATAYAGERSTFYLLVDRTGPFRLFTAVVITSCHALLLGLGMMISSMQRREFTFQSLGLPIVDVGCTSPVIMNESYFRFTHRHAHPSPLPFVHDPLVMAILDISALVLALITGYHVPPTLTVILVQWTIPLTVFFTQFTHPDGKFRGIVACRNSDEDGIGGQENETLIELEPEIDATTLAALNAPPLPGWAGYARAHLWGSCSDHICSLSWSVSGVRHILQSRHL